MAKFDKILKNATDTGAVPFVVAMYGDADGVTWAGASGDCRDDLIASTETVFRVFSMTKAVGSTAAMILADRGKLDFDRPVEDYLPEFSKVQVLEGFDGDTPILRKPKSKATVRQLASHTGGLVYEGWNENCVKYLKVTDTPNTLTGDKRSLYSQMGFDPGERWEYGIGIDWLGQVVEAVDGRRIDEFCQQEIFTPLGMKDTAFELDASKEARLAQIYARDDENKFVKHPLVLTPNPEYYGMGHAMYSTPQDYLNFLRMFLNKGTLSGHQILSAEAVNAMLANSIGDLRIAKSISTRPKISDDIDFFPEYEKTHSLGFMRSEEDVPGMRSLGSQSWAGVCNTHYWFDPARNVAAVIMTQSLPFVEKPFMALYEEFERAVYASTS